jgi:uncharacterized RDD family membrane protein YckC
MEKSSLSRPYHRHIRRRMLAFVIDLICVGLIKKVVFGAYQGFIHLAFLSNSSLETKLLNDLSEVRTPVSLLLFIGYFVFSFYMTNGRTIGTATMKIMVVREGFPKSKHHLSFADTIIRSIALVSCYILLGLPFLLAMIRIDGKGLPDILSGTLHISAKERQQTFLQLEDRQLDLPEPDEESNAA